MRPTALAVSFNGLAGAGAQAWSVAVNPSAMRGGYCGGFDRIKLTHKAIVRPLGSPGGGAG